MRSRSVLLVLLVACGSKTGLSLGVPPAREPSDAGQDVGTDANPDAGFDTFPCNWSYEEDFEVFVSSDPVLRVHGTVNTLGPAALLAVEFPASSVLVRIDPAPRSTLRWVVETEAASRVYATPAGFLVHDVLRCAVQPLDFDGTFGDARTLAPGPCQSGPAFGGRYAYEGERDTFETYELATGAQARAGERGGGPSGVPVLARDGLYHNSGDALVRDGVPIAPLTPDDQLAPDPIGGGVAWLDRGPGVAGARVVDGDVRGLSTEGLPPGLGRASTVVTNETEAIFVSDRKQLVYVPLNGGPARILPPFTTRDVSAAEVLLVDQGSAGGIAYVAPTAAGDEVRFLSIVCNR